MYIVYVYPKLNRSSVNIYDPFAERITHDLIGECKTMQREAGNRHGDERTQEEILEIGTFLFQGRTAERAAMMAAERLAKQRPGDDVYVSKVCNVMTAGQPPLVAKSVSEKGVLPL